MRNERVLVVDDEKVVRESITQLIGAYNRDTGHEVIGTASNCEETRALLNQGIRPTVALVDGLEGAGEEVARVIRDLSPETVVVSLSARQWSWGDENWNKNNMGGRDLVTALTDLSHDSSMRGR